MAWNPSKEVTAAREAAKVLDANMCIVLYFTKDGKLGMASFGETKNLCNYAGAIGDVAFDAVMSHMEKEP